jgi:hypothetical protein
VVRAVWEPAQVRSEPDGLLVSLRGSLVHFTGWELVKAAALGSQRASMQPRANHYSSSEPITLPVLG